MAGWMQRWCSVLQQSYIIESEFGKLRFIQPWNFDIGDVVRIRMIYEKQNKYVEFYKNNAKVFRGKLEKANVYCACVAMGAEN